MGKPTPYMSSVYRSLSTGINCKFLYDNRLNNRLMVREYDHIAQPGNTFYGPQVICLTHAVCMF